MIRTFFCFCLVFFLFIKPTQSQISVKDTINRRLIYKNQLGFSLGGPSFLSVNYEHFFNHHWSIDAGFGSVLVLSGAHVGVRYYVGKRSQITKFAPYIGAALGAAAIIGGDSNGGIGGYGSMVGYVPFGIQYISPKGFTFSAEVAYMYIDGENRPMGAIRMLIPTNSPSKDVKIKPKKESIPNSKPVIKTKHYSIGINLFSLFKPHYMLDLDPQRFFASNTNMDFYFQKDYTSNFAYRIPIRIGFNSSYKWTSSLNQEIYEQGRKTIIGDMGFEPIFCLANKKRIAWSIVPSICIGIGRKLIRGNIGETFNNVFQYHAGGSYLYGKIGCATGLQWNLSQRIQLGLEYGVYCANNNYYTNSSSLGQMRYLGLSGKGFVVYKFGGQLRQ